MWKFNFGTCMLKLTFTYGTSQGFNLKLLKAARHQKILLTKYIRIQDFFWMKRLMQYKKLDEEAKFE
jgi:hypothetical protein